MSKTEKVIKSLDPSHISTVLKRNFIEEKMDKFFDPEEDYSFEGNEISLNSKNSIKINFKTATKKNSYQLLLILALSQEEDFSHKLQTDFKKIKDENIDKIVIWVINQLPSETLESLKTLNINVIYFKTDEIDKIELITNFFPIDAKDYIYPVILNKLCNLLVKRLKKQFHIVLSEIAAPTYDSEYGSEANIGTKSIMEFEESILRTEIRKYISNKDNNDQLIAIDVGCGTGRHSFIIADLFDKIYGFDFSPTMISIANENKKKKEIKNIIFSVADLEYEDIYYEGEFKGKVDFIIASFGMGSFIEDTPKILRRYNQWLKPGGKILLSFYNEKSIILQITPNWRDTSLAAHIDTENNTLQVKLSEDIIFQIYCKPFNDDVKSMAEAVFDIDSIRSYPTTMALLPNSLLKNKEAFRIFSNIDGLISENPDFLAGHYILLVGTKNDELKEIRKKIKHNEIPEIVSSFLKDIQYSIINHEFVLTIHDVKKQIKLNDDSRILKSVYFKDKRNSRFICVIVQSNKKASTSKIISYLNKNHSGPNINYIGKNNFKMATEMEIYKIGFPIGGISPFGFNKNYNVIHIIDKSIKDIKTGFLYLGSGSNMSTLKMTLNSFNKATIEYAVVEIKQKSS